MTGIYIGSTSAGTGKSLFSFSFGVLLQKAGYSVGYIKPVGRIPQQVEERFGDADALVIQELLGQTVPADILTPVLLPKGLYDLAGSTGAATNECTAKDPDTKNARQAIKQTGTKRAFSPCCHTANGLSPLESIKQAYAAVSAGRDITLVSGTGTFPQAGHVCGANGLSLVHDMGLRVILIERFTGAFDLDALLYLTTLLGSTLVGVVLNDISENSLYEVRHVLVPYLEAQGCPVLGIVPHCPDIAAIRVMDLAHALSGRIVAASSQANRMVEGFLIGAMQVDNFMTYLRHNDKGAAVIVGGDRADLQLAALHGNTPCIVLTGNRSPCEMVRAKAESKGIPLILVREDTYFVAHSMERVLKSKKIGNLGQIRQAVALVAEHIDVASLGASLV